MQASRYNSRKRSLRHDDGAVSEVVGHILTLGILSTLLVASLWGFATAKDNTTERAVIVQGDALLQEITSTAVQAALFAEEHYDPTDSTGLRFSSTLDFPQLLEGHPYTVDLDEDEVIMTFPRFDTNVSSPLFQAGAGTGVKICNQDPIDGGPIKLMLREEQDLASTDPCYVMGSTDTTFVLYLEIAI